MLSFKVKYISIQFLVLFLLGNTSFLKSNPVDSLYRVIYYMNDFDSINVLIPEYRQNSGDRDLGRLYFLLGWKYDQLDSLAKSFDYYNLSRKAYNRSGDLDREHRCLENLGLLAIKNNLYQEANKYYMEALRINEKTGNKKEIAISLRDVSITLYGKPDKLRESLDYLMRSAKIFEELKEYEELSKTYLEYGAQLSRSGEHDKAIEFYNDALKYSPESKKIGAKILNNHANILLQKGEHDRALLILDSAIQIKKQLGDSNLIISSLNNLGELYYKEGYYEKAFDVFYESFYINMNQNVEQYSHDHLLTAYNYMDSAALLTGDKCRLADYGVYRDFRTRESILVSNTAIYYEKGRGFRNELMKKREDDLLKEKKLSSLVLQLGLLLLFISIVVMVIYYRDKKKRNALIDVSLQDIKARLDKYM